MTIGTSLGTITAKLDGTKAACTVNSFKYLASKKFFNNTKCHRLVTDGYQGFAVRRSDRHRYRRTGIRLRE